MRLTHSEICFFDPEDHQLPMPEHAEFMMAHLSSWLRLSLIPSSYSLLSDFRESQVKQSLSCGISTFPDLALTVLVLFADTTALSIAFGSQGQKLPLVWSSFPSTLCSCISRVLRSHAHTPLLFSATATVRSSKGEEDNELTPTGQMMILTQGNCSLREQKNKIYHAQLSYANNRLLSRT